MARADRVSPRQPRHRGGGASGRHWFTVIAAFVVVMTLTATATAGTLIWYSDHALSRVVVSALDDGAPEPSDLDGDGEVDASERAQIEEIQDVMNVLVVGSDSREGLSDEQLGELGTEDHGALLTDTIMLFQLDPRRDNAAVLSFPRDLRVEYCNGTMGRINAAYATGEESGTGGPNCLVDTVNALTGVPIHHYVSVDFAGFIDVVDTLGGVEMYLEEPLEDRYAALDLPAGCVSLDGTQALGFVRARHLDSDIGRIARQQRFLRELVAEATSAGTLMNPARVIGLASSIAATLETDSDLGLSEMRRMAYSLRGVTADAVVARTVPVVDSTIGGAYYLSPVEDQAEAVFAAFRDGSIIPDPVAAPTPSEGPSQTPTEAPEPPLNAADVDPLTVLNGAGTGGLGMSTTTYLDERGFEVATTDDAEVFGEEATRVVHPPDLADEAAVVAEAMGDAELEVGEAGTGIVVVVGEDFDPADPSLPPVPDEPPVAAEDPTATSTEASTLPPAPEQDFAGAQPSDVQC